jgi:uncharacterized protein with WD repeat
LFIFCLSITIVSTANGQLIQKIPKVKTNQLSFSPMGTYLSSWEPYAGNKVFNIMILESRQLNCFATIGKSLVFLENKTVWATCGHCVTGNPIA